MSKTLAAEIADRTMAVVNPNNRGLALDAALRRHGFPLSAGEPPKQLIDRAELLSWLRQTYAPPG